MAAVESRTIIFIIEMHHIVSPEIMEYINSLLCSGEVPSLLNKDEQESFLGQIVNEYKEQNEYRSQYDFFTSLLNEILL